MRRDRDRAPTRLTIPRMLFSALLLPIAIAPATARAGFLVAVQSTTATAGSSGNLFDVTLTNTGPGTVAVGGFAFGISAASGVTFTAVDDLTTTSPYIFLGHSTFGDDISITVSPGSLTAEDNYDVSNAGVTLTAGSTVGLGRVRFNVAAGASGPVAITLMDFPVTNFSDPTNHDITTSVGLSRANGVVTVTGNVAVPEPSSLALAAIALAIGAGFRTARRRRVA